MQPFSFVPAWPEAINFAANSEFMRPLYLLIITALFAAALAACRGPVQAKPGNDANGGRVDSAALIRQALRVIDSLKTSLQEGDLITRSDNDFESRTLQNFSTRDKSFSHSGLVFKEADGWVVYHAMTGAENPSGNCRRDPIDSFVNPMQKTGFGLFRYRLQPEEIQKLHGYVQDIHRKNIPFDVYFNLNNDDSLYCSELIWKGLQQATRGRVVLPTNLLYNFRPKAMGYKFKKLLFKEFRYVSIDNLYLNPYCTEIKRAQYFP